MTAYAWLLVACFFLLVSRSTQRYLGQKAYHLKIFPVVFVTFGFHAVHYPFASC